MGEYELYHHGIKGMKWGIRRFQNKNGRLTDAGKKRYGSMSDDAKDVYKLRQKRADQLSNAELKKVNERVRLEQEYSRLNPRSIKKGLTFVTTAATIMGTAVGLYNNSSQLVKIGKSAGSKVIQAAGKLALKGK